MSEPATDTANQSLMAAWRAAEATTAASEGAATETPATETAEAAEPTAETAEAKPEPAATEKPKTVAEVEQTGDSAELKQLKELATKLNFKLEDNRVTVHERVKLRQERQEARARIQELETELLGKLKSQKEALDPFISAADAFDRDDLDAFAKALGKRKGHNWESWNDLQKHAMHSLADPNYRKLQELEQKHREREEADKRRQEQERQVAENRQRQEAVANYKKSLQQEMLGSADPLVKALADDAAFVHAVYSVQDQHYDRASDSTLTIEEALATPATPGAKPLRDQMKGLYERLHKAFGGEVATAATAPKKTGKTGAVKREAEATHVSKPGGVGYMDPEDRKYWEAQLKASMAE